MKTNYRYQLETTGKKHICPSCNKLRFVRYIDTETKQYLPGIFGRCDRESNCSYHEIPPHPETIYYFVPFNNLVDYSNKAYQIETDKGNYFIPKSQVCEVIEHGFYVSEYVLTKDSSKAPFYISNDYKSHTNPEIAQPQEYKPQPKAKPQPVYYIPETVLNATLKGYHLNTFIQNLLRLAPVEDLQKVIELYRVGTISKGERSGAVTFPFIDRAGNIREIQVKQFDETNHTKGEPCTISYLYKRHYSEQGEALPGWLQDFTKNEKQFSCLFGEHLLNRYQHNPVALVEAPKTAIIGTLYYGLPKSPNALLWLAVYNKSSLTVDKCKALAGRKVVLFPDLNAFQEWNTKAQELKAKLPGTQFVVSDLLERSATPAEISSGLDLADYLTRFDISLFRGEGEHIPPPQEETPPQPRQCSHSEPIKGAAPEPKAENAKSENCENETKHLFRDVLPLRAATGKLKELETLFIGNTQRSRTKYLDRENIIRLFDSYKRIEPQKEKLDELETLILSK